MTSANDLLDTCDTCTTESPSGCLDCLAPLFADAPTAMGDDTVVLNLDQARAVRLLRRAGLLPAADYRQAG